MLPLFFSLFHWKKQTMDPKTFNISRLVKVTLATTGIYLYYMSVAAKPISVPSCAKVCFSASIFIFSFVGGILWYFCKLRASLCLRLTHLTLGCHTVGYSRFCFVFPCLSCPWINFTSCPCVFSFPP